MIIDNYLTALKCKKCKKYSFEILTCFQNKSHKLCYECVNECANCNTFISDFDRCNFPIYDVDENDILYFQGSKCSVCGKFFCNKCIGILYVKTRSNRLIPIHECKNCTVDPHLYYHD